ncbi:hypothetical protein ACHQM5_020507 [Ranunculus cassubicifolius]
MERKRNGKLFIPTRIPISSSCLLCIFLLFCSVNFKTTDSRASSIKESNAHMQVTERRGENEASIADQRNEHDESVHLNGLGSFPPRCKAKCGNCTPCKPVHVPVPPGTSEPTEYYPEAWRCKCGNKLYMP